MPQPPQTRKSEHADPHEQYNPVPRVVLVSVTAETGTSVAWDASATVMTTPAVVPLARLPSGEATVMLTGQVAVPEVEEASSPTRDTTPTL